MYRTIVARLPDYALQRRTIPRIGTSMAAPPGVGSQKKAPAALRRERGPPHRATPDAVPRQARRAGFRTAAGPRRTRRIGSVSLIAPPLSRPPGTQKQKIGPNCNFFAIANCRGAPKCGSRSKNSTNRPFWRLISSLWGCKSVRNRKKVAKEGRFLFLRNELP